MRDADESTIVQLLPAERAKAFIDAVIAIAMTLLILPLMESAAELDDNDGAGEWFSKHQSQIITFVISFVIIGSFWFGHHRVFAHVERMSQTLLWLSLGWLLTIVWLPVPTALTGRAADGSSGVVLIYIGSMLAAGAMWLLIRIYLGNAPRLHDLTGAQVRGGVGDGLASVILFAAAGVLTALVPSVGYYSLFVMFLSGAVQWGVAPLLRRWTPADGTANQSAVSDDT
ncbi:DUF1211 domain-containing membrane protein [Gordonia spumicola]|uniref:DUF1211 domain-containing membrane protein n=2 Tax=Gordonia spumicola TaxID=589161 RepID=A0A7I9VD82_9ACTN|nr:DUF1211 domain-containing membrane protein [Gordonia spumicola]